jgi:hypothetical protein
MTGGANAGPAVVVILADRFFAGKSRRARRRIPAWAKRPGKVTVLCGATICSLRF